jgi:hypothetical protein
MEPATRINSANRGFDNRAIRDSGMVSGFGIDGFVKGESGFPQVRFQTGAFGMAEPESPFSVASLTSHSSGTRTQGRFSESIAEHRAP